MYILGLDTSCDDTSVAVYDSSEHEVLSEAVSSQTEMHARYGGVVPELAARKHLEYIIPLIEHVMDEAGIAPDPQTVDLIAVTRGPGLIGGLLVGLSCAKALSLGWEVPFVGVNHIHGHLVSAELSVDNLEFPHIAMVVSGGHSEIYLAKSHANHVLLGETRDDAAGELLDKTGRLLDIPFPAGPTIDRWTIDLDPDETRPTFPRPLLNQDNLEFSFSGLKTACLYHLKSEEGKKYKREAVGAEVLIAAVDCLLGKSFLAAKRHGIGTVVISGGVAASEYFRMEAHKKALENGIDVIFPERKHCTDNAAMIALAGYYRFMENGPDPFDIDCDSSLSLT